MRKSQSHKPRAHASFDSPTPFAEGSALGAELDLSDGTSSVVVLQASDKQGTAGWASFLPHVLAGQTAVYILRQQPGEELAELDRRVRQRISNSEPETQRVLWVASPDAPRSALAKLRPMLTGYCSRDRDVLLVSGANVMLMAPSSEPDSMTPDEPELAEPETATATAETTMASGPTLAGSPRRTHPGGASALAKRSQSESGPERPTPERSEVRWESPVPDDVDDPSSRSA